jgi:galactokinase
VALPAELTFAILRVAPPEGRPASPATPAQAAPASPATPPPAAPAPTASDALRARREAECSRAVGLIAERIPSVASLRDLDGRSLPALRRFLPEALARRVEHVVTENERVLDAESALEQGDVARLGRLLSASHRSLRRNYSLGSEIQDEVRKIAAATRGVIGARMLARGDDCVVALVQSERLDAAVQRIDQKVGRRGIGRLSIATAVAGEGAGQLDLFTPAKPASIEANRSY